MAAQNGNGNGVSRIQLYIAAAGVMLTMLTVGGSAMWWLANLSAHIQAVDTQSGQDATRIGEMYHRQDERNRDVQDMRDRLSRLEMSICQQLARVETQFGTTETIINKDNVDNQRAKDAINAKLFGMTPSGIYYDIKIPHEVTPC